MSIEKKFYNINHMIAFPNTINDLTLCTRIRSDDNQMPQVNAADKMSNNVKSRTTRLLVAVPIANSSLMA
jgi:hypothetical protein